MISDPSAPAMASDEGSSLGTSHHSIGKSGLRETLPADEHILKTKDFREAYRNGRSIRRESFVMYCRPNGLGRRRIGFSISSRSIKLAVRRNRIRRCFKEAYRKARRRLAGDVDIVIVVKRDPGKSYTCDQYEKIFRHLTKGHGILS